MDKESQKNLMVSIELAQILRNQVALDHWMGVMSTLQEKPSLYRHKIKRMYQQFQKEYDTYCFSIRNIFINNTEVDTYEYVLDAEVEYSKPIMKYLTPYAGAIQRILLLNQYSEHEYISKLSAAQHLLGMVSYIAGAEYKECPAVGINRLMHVGGTLVEESTYNRISDRQVPPSVIGHFSQMAKRIVNAVCQTLGYTNELVYTAKDRNDTIVRDMEMYSDLTFESLQDYTLIKAFYTKPDLTWEQATEIANKMDKKYEEQQAKAN